MSLIFAHLTDDDLKACDKARIPRSAVGVWLTRGRYLATTQNQLAAALRALGWTTYQVEHESGQTTITQVKPGLPRDDQASNRATRAEVYHAINSERDFQDNFVIPERRYYNTHTLGEFILMLNQYAAQAQAKWTHHSDVSDGFPESLHEVRKLAALAVRCMEQHGAPPRTVPPAPQGLR